MHIDVRSSVHRRAVRRARRRRRRASARSVSRRPPPAAQGSQGEARSGRHDRRRGVPAGPEHDHARGQRPVDRHDRRARARTRLQAAARLLVRAVALRQGLHGHRRSARSRSTARSGRRRSGPTTCPITADDFKFTFDTIMNPKNNVVTRNGYDKIREFNVRESDRVPDGVRGDLRPVPRPVGEHEHAGAAEARARGHELQQGLEHLHLRPEDEEADLQRSDARAVVQARTSRSRWSRTRTTGGRRRRCPKVVFIPITDSNSEINAFRAGEVDMIYPQNQIGLRKRIESADDAKYTSTLGPQWEHFDMLVDGARPRRRRRCARRSPPRCRASRSSTAS